MAFNGSGTFNRIHDWTDDRDAGTKVNASRMDAEMDGMATGISTCITKDGQTNPTANLKMNSRKHTGVAAGTARTDYGDVGSVQDGGYNYALDSGAADVYVIGPSPAITAYATGMTFVVKIGSGNTNTGASTINVSGVGAKSIKTPDGTNPEAGAMIAGQIAIICYDGTNFQLVSVPSEMQISEFATGTEMVFHQASAPTGWTRSADNDQVLRVVSGSGGGSGSGGSNSIVGGTSTSGAGGSHTHSGPSHTHTGPSHTHTSAAHTHGAGSFAGPSHTHTLPGVADLGGASAQYRITSLTTSSSGTGSVTGTSASTTPGATGAGGTGATGASGTGNTGAESTHTHVITPAIKYRDVHIAAKD
jgi:hypothetical protein